MAFVTNNAKIRKLLYFRGKKSNFANMKIPRIPNKYRSNILLASAAIVLISVVYWIVRPGSGDRHEKHGDGLTFFDENDAVSQVNVLYGIDYTDLQLEEGRIGSGQTIGGLFSRYGISPVMIDRTDRAARDVFPLRRVKAGNAYTAFLTNDSIPRLRHFVYEDNIREYVIISYEGDSVSVRKETKDVVAERRIASGEIDSSLWLTMQRQGMPQSMISSFENIFQWTVDFFGIRAGDSFTVIYDEHSIDGKPVGAGTIWGAVFRHNGKDYYAIPFVQNGRVGYWDQNGNSLKKSMLKAPLNYTRISSRFSNARMHPVHRVVRPHHGVDYAAPAGTPVVAVADGTVSFRGWDRGGGGNTLKIKHARGMETGYLHLQRFASGIVAGKRVSQGEVIGYVGATGTATGPHLDYRVWINGKATDPLRVTSEPAEPLAASARPDFDLVRDRVMAELAGTLDASLRITQLDSIAVYRRQNAELAAERAAE